MKPANEDEFFAESTGDWVISILAVLGALSAFFIAIGATL